MPKRNDATFVNQDQAFKKLFPYLMPRKCDSLVYLNLDLDLTKTLEFIRNNQNNILKRKYRVFEVLIAAFIRLFVIREELNRFIMNKKLWQRNDISINFIAKEDYKDEANEHSIVLNFDKNVTLNDISQIINEKILDARNATKEQIVNPTDNLVNIFSSFPSPIITLLISIIKFLDIKGKAPLSLTKDDGLHCSAYLSNLGSIGLNTGAVHHHLYQWGTTSIFITIGALKRKRIKTDEGFMRKDSIEIGLTIDERIADGYYFVKSLNVLQDILNNPEQLLTSTYSDN